MTKLVTSIHTNQLNFVNSETSLAYDATLEVWSAALDLRDKEAKGHSRRVTEMTLSMAKAMCVEEEGIIHIRRGALLHDIGNMAVPESILHKQGELTTEEWVVIHLHPYYGYELLAPISILNPALDIPYFHHEKWDGSGYPRGLKGEQIPMAARIFAAADVWDALTSDRPFRKAWKETAALDYIRTQSGRHFDPQVVEVFLQIKPYLSKE